MGVFLYFHSSRQRAGAGLAAPAGGDFAQKRGIVLGGEARFDEPDAIVGEECKGFGGDGMRGGAMGALIGQGDADAGGAVVAEAAVADVLRGVPFAAAAFAAAHEGAMAVWLRMRLGMWLRNATRRIEEGAIEGDIGALPGLDPPRRYRGPAVLEPGGGADEASNMTLNLGHDEWGKDGLAVGRGADGDAS